MHCGKPVGEGSNM